MGEEKRVYNILSLIKLLKLKNETKPEKIFGGRERRNVGKEA